MSQLPRLAQRRRGGRAWGAPRRAGMALLVSGALLGPTAVASAAFGSVTTQRAGEAIVAYLPIPTGRQVPVRTAALPADGAATSAFPAVAVSQKTDPLLPPLEASRPDGSIGRVVVVVLLGIVLALWFTLVAVVVRVNFASERRSSKPGTPV